MALRAAGLSAASWASAVSEVGGERVEAVLSLSKARREGVCVCELCCLIAECFQKSNSHCWTSRAVLRALWVLLAALTPAVLLSVAHHSFPSTPSAF